MLDASRRLALGVATAAIASLSLTGVADAAHHRSHRTRHHVKHHRLTAASRSATTSTSSTSSSSSSNRSGGRETELTGDTAAKANAAALAAVPGTAWRASTEDPSDSSGAAYEVHVTRSSDGSEVEVLEDSAFNVIATQASPQSPGGGGGRGGCGHDDGGSSSDSSSGTSTQGSGS